MIDRDTIAALLQEVGPRVGYTADHDWSVTEVDDLGWVCIPPSVGRISFALAITPRGKMATFTRVALSAADALRTLASVPDDVAPPHPSQAASWRPQPIDEVAASSLARRFVEGVPDIPADWQSTQVEGLGWIFPFGQAAIVVTTRGVVRVAEPGRAPEQVLAAATVPDLLSIIKTARSADETSRDPQ